MQLKLLHAACWNPLTDRLHFCPKEVQMKWFERQLELSKATEKPLFLHLREYSGEINEETADLKATDDFLNIVARNKDSVASGGVVHSFTGSLDELNRILNATSFFIGINGCSLKTKENLEVVKGSSDSSHFIFEINVGKSRIRHIMTLNLNDAIFNRF